MYQKPLPNLDGKLAGIAGGAIQYAPEPCGRLILRGGRVIDPGEGLDAETSISLNDGMVQEVGDNIRPEKGDAVISCEGLYVWPGLVDIHLHIHDLFEVSTHPAECAACDGVTLGFSPGAGNTFLAPALLGAEMDRGFPINAGVFLGAGHVLSCRLSSDELVALFEGRLPSGLAQQKLTRNAIANRTAALTVGIKEHMGHALMRDEDVDRVYDITSKAHLMFMSHTQDAEHTMWIEGLSKGRPLHLGHVTAAGRSVESMQQVLDVCKKPHVSAEFVGTMLRAGGGNREGAGMDEQARQLALQALANGTVDVLVSDGQCDATMKGFGDTRDNIPAILELARENVLSLSRAVATMTSNPARLMAAITHNNFWQERIGRLTPGAFGNVTIVHPKTMRAVYTIVNGVPVAFENRLVRGGYGAGRWLCAKGMVRRMGVGDVAMFNVVR